MLTKVPKCNRIAECMENKRCVWQGNPANKDLKCAFFENKLKKMQEEQLRQKHNPEFKTLTRVTERITKLTEEKNKQVNALNSKVEKVKIEYNTKIERLKGQQEKLKLSIYGSEKQGGTL